MVNKVILIGNLGLDPEIRTLETGVKVARLRVATTERFTSQSGEKKEHTEWHTVVLWRSQADFAERFLHKGTQVYVDGKIRSRERVEESGMKKNIYEIHVDEIRSLGKKEPQNTVATSEVTNGTPTFGGTYNTQPISSEAETIFNADPLPF